MIERPACLRCPSATGRLASVLSADDILDGEEVVPGFRVRVPELFEV